MIEVGRSLFAENGYSATSIDEICRRTRLTRGALYHHFSDGKEGLFRAVLEDVKRELVRRVSRKARAGPDSDPWEVLEAGIAVFLTETSDPAVQQIVLIDGPSVLGYTEWHEIDARHSTNALTVALKEAMGAGEIDTQPVEPLTRLLLAALTEASLSIAKSDQPAQAKERLTDAALSLLGGLRRADPGN